MKKLRTVLAAALLTIPLLTLNASAVAEFDGGPELNPTHQVTACCFVYFMSRWWCFPC